jgi:maleate isomerase
MRTPMGGVVLDGAGVPAFARIGDGRAYPNAKSFRHKFGLIVPATNTTMEHDLWSIVFRNQGARGLRGVGFHTSNVVTPSAALRTDEDRLAYGRAFVQGLTVATEIALLAQPHSFILGMSLEHVIAGLEAVRAPAAELEARTGLSCAAWHDAIPAALDRYGARRIGLLTPFDRHGNAAAAQMFEELGYEVVTSAGFSCADARHIAHVPDWAKERAILELLATDAHALDAVVQCGTNMSVLEVSERLEPLLGIPILGINPVTFWYALRQNGFVDPLTGGGRLLCEF